MKREKQREVKVPRNRSELEVGMVVPLIIMGRTLIPSRFEGFRGDSGKEEAIFYLNYCYGGGGVNVEANYVRVKDLIFRSDGIETFGRSYCDEETLREQGVYGDILRKLTESGLVQAAA